MSDRRVVLASGNAGKLREFGALLAPLNWTLLSQTELHVSEAEEPYSTFVENALAKARHASRASKLPALADDSGLCVPALNFQPGVVSARFALLAGREDRVATVGADTANNEELLRRLRACKGAEDWHFPAYFSCVLVLVRNEQDPEPLVAQGRWNGEILPAPRGSNGFGYDPLFYLPELGQTAAELSAEIKNSVSHRGQAMRALLQALQARGADQKA